MSRVNCGTRSKLGGMDTWEYWLLDSLPSDQKFHTYTSSNRMSRLHLAKGQFQRYFSRHRCTALTSISSFGDNLFKADPGCLVQGRTRSRGLA